GEELDALRKIFLVNERASFEFVSPKPTFARPHNEATLRYTQWVYDVLDTWLIQSEGEGPPVPGTQLDDRRFGMISVKDRRLLQDALDGAAMPS
ncbi:MAG: hypothetical protein M3319_11315, partial [Actinomycetota bacterium]|nr:hypothetical protein [Actinomycetota bacterium]